MKYLNLARCLGLGLCLALAGCDTGPDLRSLENTDTAWRLVNPRPFDVKINDFWGDPGVRMFAVGDAGAVMVKEGAVWREAPPPTSTDITSVHGCDWEHVWAVCGEGLLFFDGLRWTLARPGYRQAGDRIWCRAPDDVMLVTVENESQHFDGRSWLTQKVPVSRAYGAHRNLVGWQWGYTVVGTGGQATTWNTGVWGPVQSVDPGVELTDVVLNVRDDWVSEAPSVVTLGRRLADARYVGLYLGDGTQWQSDFNGINIDGSLLDVSPVGNGGGCYLVTRASGGDTVRVQHSWGFAPTHVLPGLDRAVLHVASNRFDVRDHLDYFDLAGSGGTFFTGNNYDGFDAAVGGIPYEPTALQVWPNGDFTGMNSGHRLLQARAGHVSVQDLGLATGLRAIWGPDPQTIFAVGLGGLIVRLSPHEAPVVQNFPTSATLTAVWGTAADDVWAAGYGAFLHFDGTDWQSLPHVAGLHVERLTGLGTDTVYASGFEEVWQWNGSLWTHIAQREEVSVREMAAAPDEDALFALGHLYRSPYALLRYHDGQWSQLCEAPRLAESLIPLGGGQVLVVANGACLKWEGEQWQALPGSTFTSRQGTHPPLYGNATGGVYTIGRSGSIYYLDLGGTGLWR